jgi:short-subunit dehydrogenase
LVNNAGVAEDAERVIDINLKSLIDATQLALAEFAKLNKVGTIINISSLAAIVPAPQAPVYSASKAGVC